MNKFIWRTEFDNNIYFREAEIMFRCYEGGDLTRAEYLKWLVKNHANMVEKLGRLGKKDCNIDPQEEAEEVEELNNNFSMLTRFKAGNISLNTSYIMFLAYENCEITYDEYYRWITQFQGSMIECFNDYEAIDPIITKRKGGDQDVT